MTTPIHPQPVPSFLRRFGASLLRIASIPAAGYLLLLAFMYFQQERLIFPGSASQGRPESRVRPPAGAELVSLTTRSGDQVTALFGGPLTADGKPLPSPRGRPVILLFYGNGTCLSQAVGTVQALRKLGCSVLCPDYVGFGASTGRPSERGCRETADAALAYVRARPEVDPAQVVAFGYSLGGAVAIDLAARERIRGLVACNTFTSMGDMVARLYPFAPTFLLKHPFGSLARIGSVRCPVLLVRGTDDTLIPGEMRDRLARAARSPVTTLDVDGADHNRLFAAGGNAFLKRLQAFIVGPD